MSKFNVADSLAQGPACAYQRRTSTGTWKQFWLDALPAATNDSYGYQRELNPGSLGTCSLPSPLSCSCFVTKRKLLNMQNKTIKYAERFCKLTSMQFGLSTN